ncbi:hypothetical protein ACWN8V_06635 [Vagococcus elongatus]|uniref:Uncharacterized protein n=1 Tax=Vagococcus elongatus TaxID=180344 RepID=A0A430AVX5_9ENTE|nr:hypothetical protein [Vagococcus elongatus]RSU12210.1 hypothetical protein CBF29_06325 [Vagococcus elongatus]
MKTTKVYGILSWDWFKDKCPGEVKKQKEIPMVAFVSDNGAVYVAPGDNQGIEHFSIFAEKEFNTSNYSIRSGETGLDFTFEDEVDPTSDYRKIKNYIDLVLQVEPNKNRP